MDRLRHIFPKGARIVFAAMMLFVLSLSGMMGAASKASAFAAQASGLAVLCVTDNSDGKANGIIQHCDNCLVQTLRDPAPDLSGLEGTAVAIPAPAAVKPVFVHLTDEPLSQRLLTRRSTPPRAPPAMT